MKASRPFVLSVALSLLIPGVALAQAGVGSPASGGYAPVYISQSLPPIQGYEQSGSGGFTNYGAAPAQTPYQQPSPYVQPQYNAQPQPYAQQQPYGQQQQPPLQGYVATAPAGTIVNASLMTPISSEYARIGDRVNAVLGSAIAAGGSVLLPAGSQLEGQVMMVRPAGRTGRNGELDLRFTSATLPNGQRVPISARIQTEDGTGVIKGGTTAGRMGRAAVSTGLGAGLGAALGTAMGPLSGGKVGRGAIYGTAVGAGLGALGAGVQKGKPAVLDTSEPVNIVLDQPLTTSPMPGMQGGYQQPAAYPQQQQSSPSPYPFYGQ